MKKFSLIIRKHSQLGYLFMPFWVENANSRHYQSVSSAITSETIDKDKTSLSDQELLVFKLIEEYNTENLKKLFSKQNLKAKEFYDSLDKERIKRFIRPYIDNRLFKIIKLLQKTDIPVFFPKSHHTALYEDDRVEIIIDTAAAVFHFKRKPEGTLYQLRILHDDREIKLKNGRPAILTNDPCSVLIDKKLFLINDLDGKKLKPFFTKDYIHISPKFEDKYYKTFVKKTIRDYTVKAEGFDIVEKDILPVASISLETGITGELVLIMSFIYDDHKVQAGSGRDVLVRLEDKNQNYVFTKTLRDQGFEAKQIQNLLNAGLKQMQPGIFTRTIEKNAELQNLHLVSWLNKNSQWLKDLGIEVQQNSTEKKFWISNIVLDIENIVSPGETDWFDVRATVKIGDNEIPFIKFRDNILNDNREYVLPDKTVVVLPESWFEKYKDLFTFASSKGERISYHKHHLPLLEKNTEGINDNYIKHFKKINSLSIIEEQQPRHIKFALRNYQKLGLAWLLALKEAKLNGCLADDMGLGKTLQVIALLVKLKEKANRSGQQGSKHMSQSIQLSLFDQPENSSLDENLSDGDHRPSLIVVPKSLVFNWHNEITKFTDHLQVLKYESVGRIFNKAEINSADVVLTTYGIVRNDIDKLNQIQFNYVILDESRYIKNPGSLSYKSVIRLKCNSRLVLTGTPIENSLTDLWTQMNFLNPGLLGSLNFFKNMIARPIEKYGDDDKRLKLKKLTRPFILRRTKSQVAKELPNLSIQTIYHEMTKEQQDFYEKIKARNRNAILDTFQNKVHQRHKSIIILKGLMQLRQAANHPLILDKNFSAESDKFRDSVEIIETIINSGHKVLVFSAFVEHLKIFKKYFEKNDIDFSYLTGETSQRKRQSEVESFQRDRDIKVFLISINAGGFGLNLTAAEYVIILDPWWNPAVERQAIDRAHRIGQENKVIVYRMITKNSIEEKISAYRDKKAKLSEDILEPEENILNRMSEEDILELFF